MSFVGSKDKPKDIEKEPILPVHSLSGGIANTNPKVDAFLGKGSKVVGTLTFSGPVELDGFIEGEINSSDRLVIGEGAVINGKVKGAEVLVKGQINGDVIASKKLSLRRPAKVLGNISSTNLSIEEGVIFEGKCSMEGIADSSSKITGPAKIGLSA